MIPAMSTTRNPSILLVNPWIHDFSAYDFWMKPLGLLYIGSILREAGYEIRLLDLLDFSSLIPDFQQTLKTPKRRDFGRGHFFKEEIEKPKAFADIPLRYRRYGIPPAAANEIAAALPRPDVLLVTSSMTYWYTGLQETIRFLRRTFPGVPVLLGGIYATLCFDHAVGHSGADRVLPGPWDERKMDILSEYAGTPSRGGGPGFVDWPYPAFDLYPARNYVCLLTRRGCPFSCAYCASSRLTKGVETRPATRVIEEMLYWHERFGVRDFAVYDDAFLAGRAGHAVPLLEEVVRRGLACHFHTPNALHVQEIDDRVAGLLFRSGFKTIRLGLETADETLQRETGGKTTNEGFRRAVRSLKKAGYAGEEIGAYLLAGLPGQRTAEVKESIAFVRDAGARPVLAEYSPIPGTPLFEKAQKISPFDIANEPLYQNNSILPCRWEGFGWGDFRRLKDELRGQSSAVS